MNTTLVSLFFCGVIFVGMFLCMEIGLRIGTRRLASDPEGARQGIGALEGGVFGLLGLLIAFTFSGAATRFDGRRHLVRLEANAIGTAWLRLELVAPEARTQLQGLFRQYLDSRLESYRKLPDIAAMDRELVHSVEIQGEIWNRAVAAAGATGSAAAQQLLLAALNEMIDIVTTRREAMNVHPPRVIFCMLGILSLVASLMAGYGMAGAKSRSWIHIIGFIVVMTVTDYVIMDMEYPRLGLIRIDDADKVLIELRASMD